MVVVACLLKCSDFCGRNRNLEAYVHMCSLKYMFLHLLQVVRNFKFVAAFKKFLKNSRKYQRFKTLKTFE